jgi:ubiquinone/menaquinone biosynthesis C-methylase UbiE
MASNRKLYRWFYDHIHSKYYNLLMKWCALPFGSEKKMRQTMLEVVPLQPGDRVLDMCCGTGNTTFAIAERVGERSEIEGIDLSRGQIRVAKRQNRFSNVKFMVMDASQTCFREGDFDKVVIPHALHEMSRTTRLAVLREARRVLRDGGTLAVMELDNPPGWLLRLFVGFWCFYWLPFNFETPTRRDMMRHGVAEEVREAGFGDVSKTSMYNGVLQVVQGKKLARVAD